MPSTQANANSDDPNKMQIDSKSPRTTSLSYPNFLPHLLDLELSSWEGPNEYAYSFIGPPVHDFLEVLQLRVDHGEARGWGNKLLRTLRLDPFTDAQFEALRGVAWDVRKGDGTWYSPSSSNIW